MATPTTPHTCQLCERRPGMYSETRCMFVCENCWQAIGRMEIALERAIADGHWRRGDDL